MAHEDYHALIRFGLGRKGNEALPTDPQAWLARQLDGPDPVLAMPGASGVDGLIALQAQRDMVKTVRAESDGKVKRPEENPVRDLFRAEQAAYVQNLLHTELPFRERLVSFWFNHFTVSLKRGECYPTIYPYIREAIRPHVTGHFTDMVLAVMRHPSMIMYLDNQQSFGPDSFLGKRQRKGINENLARECMELHTITPASGYTQADVTSFANILTGWSIELKENPIGFRYRKFAHQPGEHVVMGQTFPEGEEGGIQALTWLSQHRSTYHNLATKLVRHFVADQPPPAAISRIERVLIDTRGDLKAATLELIRLPEAWTPLAKLRTPQDYVIAVLRAADLPQTDKSPDVPGILAGLGQPLLAAPLPNGWADTASDWTGSEAMLRRVDWAYGYSGRLANADAAAFGIASLGPLLSNATLDQIRLAGSRRDAMTMLLTSPEFQRR